MTTHQEYKRGLSSERRTKIETRAKKLIHEEYTLRQLRKARNQSQATIAEILGIRPSEVAKLERRTDSYLSTIRRYVEAMGGRLDLIASFPDGPPVKIMHLSDLAEYEEPEAGSLIG